MVSSWAGHELHARSKFCFILSVSIIVLPTTCVYIIYSEAVAVGQLHVALRDLVSALVWTHNLDFDFVRREQAIILDPSPTQLQRCDNLIEQNKKKQKVK
jgi:hypothetical protein